MAASHAMPHKVFFPSGLVGALFCRYAACATASSHRKVGRFLAISIALANSKRVLLNLFATLFCEGEYGAVVSIIIPSSAACSKLL